MKNNLGFHETFQVAQGSKIKVIVIGCHIYLPQKKFDRMFQERLGQIYVYCQKTMKRTNLRWETLQVSDKYFNSKTQ